MASRVFFQMVQCFYLFQGYQFFNHVYGAHVIHVMRHEDHALAEASPDSDKRVQRKSQLRYDSVAHQIEVGIDSRIAFFFVGGS